MICRASLRLVNRCSLRHSPQAPVEALHEAILHRFARRDVVPLDVAILFPSQDGVRGELGAVGAGRSHAGNNWILPMSTRGTRRVAETAMRDTTSWSCWMSRSKPGSAIQAW